MNKRRETKGNKLDVPTQRLLWHQAEEKESQDGQSPGTGSPSSQGSSSPVSCHSSSVSCHDSTMVTPNIIIEKLEDEQKHVAFPPPGLKLANEKWRNRRKKSASPRYTGIVSQWVVVTHVVNPSHFYVHYVAEKKEVNVLSKKINHFCSEESSRFSTCHTVDTGSLIFVKFEDGLWYRARVLEVFQAGSAGAVKSCPVSQIASVHIFLIDTGLTIAITINSEDRESETFLNAVNNCLRRFTDLAKAEVDFFVPLAIRCSLQDLEPYDLTNGWTKEAQNEFHSMVRSTAVKMQILGQDKDSLLVDLKKVPINRATDPYISVREHLVLIEVARFYFPVNWNKRSLLYYLPVCPRINTELNAVVSYIRTPSDFYIQLVDNMEFLLLSDKLQKYYNAPSVSGKDDLHVYCPVIGEACVALFEDKQWYRAQVTGHRGGRKVEVFFVDFGDKRILPVSDLRKIKYEFFALPAMAVNCCLSGVVPQNQGTWSEACTSWFISLTGQKLVTIVATANAPKHGPLPVKLFESSLNGPLDNIGELLVKEELACFKEGLKPNSTKLKTDDSEIWDPSLELGSEDGSTVGDETNGTEFQPQLKLPSQLKDVKVRVSHVNSPSSFYVHFTKYDSWLKRVCELLKQECVDKEPEDIVWRADMYCAAHINGVWERAQLCTDVLSNNIAEVIRCDHGNKAKLHISQLLPLPPELIGSLALECTLCDIRPAGGQSTWTATACAFISFCLSGASAKLTAKEVTEVRPVPVTLSCSNTMGQFVSFADSLLSQGLALRERNPKSEDSSPDVQKPKEPDSAWTRTQADADKKDITLNTISPKSGPRPSPHPHTIMTTEMAKTELYLAPELPCTGHLQMIVCAVGEDGTIYSRTLNAECQLDHLRKRIQQSMKFQPRHKLYTWKTVQGCAMYGPDMLCYRGQCLEVLGSHIKVQYIDYGHVMSVPVSYVNPTLLFEDVPQLCLPCQLHGIVPVGGRWQRDAVALLSELLLNRCVDVQVLELPSDPRGPLSVELFLDGLSLSRIMCENKYGSMDQIASSPSISFVIAAAPFLDDWDIDKEGLLEEEPVLGSFIYPELPLEGEEFPVRVKHLWTPNELFLWPQEGMTDVEVNGNTLDEALSRISGDIDHFPRLSSFPCGGPCMAKYSDGKYYRVKIIAITSVEPLLILVQHVDYGSDDTLSTAELRQILPDLLQFPTRGLKVKVAGFRAPSVNRQEYMLPYSPSWSVRAAMDMIDLLHGYITASVVACEPELTVRLYNEDGQPVHMPLVSSGLAELE